MVDRGSLGRRDRVRRLRRRQVRNHGSELASFREYSLPAPELFVYVIGVLELAGGLLLVSGRLVRFAAIALAADMVGAIVVSGFGRGEYVSLTLAPALLIAMAVLIWKGR